MADEGEIDVLGDFDEKIEIDSNVYDTNELPSKSANLLPEFTDPPWLLEPAWTLDSSCMDEKSKATIEKMLLEEQYYINGKSARSKHCQQQQQQQYVRQQQEQQQVLMSLSMGDRSNTQDRSDTLENNAVTKTKWTDEEISLLNSGIEIYGNKWSKISELIPTRTTKQIKNFAYKYLKKSGVAKSQPFAEVSPPEVADTLSTTLQIVTTASPTVKTASAKGKPKNQRGNRLSLTTLRNNFMRLKKKKAARGYDKETLSFTSKMSVEESSSDKQTSRNSSKKKSNRRGHSDSFKSKQHDEVQQGALNTERRLPGLILDKKFTITPGLIENLDGFCAVSEIITANQEKKAKLCNGDAHGDNDDVDSDIDIDIENDDDDTENNSLWKCRSTSPNSIYEKLVSDASLTIESKNLNSTLEGDSQDEVTAVKEDRELGDEGKESDDSRGPSFQALGSEDQISREKDNQELEDMQKFELRRLEKLAARKRDEATARVLDAQKVLVNALVLEDGEVVHFGVPAAPRVLQVDVITDQEKHCLREFFENRPSKTPERYLKIRNYITESWNKTKPNYLNKTSVRPGLKNCGDVNSIGRVHSYLECIGVINFGCEQASYKNPRPVFTLFGRDKVTKDCSQEVNQVRSENMRPRKRKVKDAFGQWIDEKDLEGITIQHDKTVDSQQKEVKVKNSKSFYDPFKLVPCLSFSEDHEAPFEVEIYSSCLVVMDMHSHISKTEVIGMLGGRYCDELGKLTITIATPCNSISTGLQCEMDPVSQTQASEKIREAGMDVVGWYHSHPSFAPNPSVRDIETQLKFQDWFAQGGSNFVGVIVSPYCLRNASMCSEINCLTVSQEFLPQLQCNIPYKFQYSTVNDFDSDISSIVPVAQELASCYHSYQNKVDLSSWYNSVRGITCLDKMLESISSHCPNSDNSCLLADIKKAFLQLCDSQTSDFMNIATSASFTDPFVNS